MTLEANVDNGNWGSWYFGTRNGGQDATVTVSGSAASTISGSGNIALGANTQFNVADATGDAATDLTVSAILATGASFGSYGRLHQARRRHDGTHRSQYLYG